MKKMLDMNSVLNRKLEDVHPIFHYLYKRNEYDKHYLRNYIEATTVIYNHLLQLKRFKTIIPFGENELKPKDYLILYQPALKEILHSFHSNSICLISWIQLPFTIFHGVKTKIKFRTNYFILTDIITELFDLFINDPLLKSERAARIFQLIRNIILKVNPKFLINANDSDPVTRLFILEARELGIKSVCIQDGLFKKKDNFSSHHGEFSDYIFVWGGYYMDLFTENGVNQRKLKVLGYPGVVLNSHQKFFNKEEILLVGEGFGYCNKELELLNYRIYREVVEILLANGYKLYFKPHPGTNYGLFKDLRIPIINYSVKKCFKKFDVFIGLVSTMLMEASLNNKIGIQIYDDRFPGDHYENEGLCYTVLSQNLPLLSEVITKIDIPFKIKCENVLLEENIQKKINLLLASL